MATRKTKFGDEEKLDDANIEKVIKLLEPEDGKPITKKLACEMLNITYNTTRLNTLIEKYKEKKERTARLRAEKRGKPVTIEDAKFIISSYLLDGEPLSSIVESSHRSLDIVKKVLDDYHVPLRASKHDYFKPELIPEGAVRDRFKEKEIVYSARYDSTAIVDAELPGKDGYVYRIWLLSEKWKQSAYQPAEELASLEHLKELGIKL